MAGPPKFDHDQVVAEAIGAFFPRGFEATTLPDLEAATGVDRSTLHNSFGGKTGLYRCATDTYLSVAEAGLFAPLLVGTDDGWARSVDLIAGPFPSETGPGLTVPEPHTWAWPL